MIPGRHPTHPSFSRSFLFALQGLRTAIRQERNIKVMLAGGIGVIILGFVMKLDIPSWIVVILCIGIVISSELVNTAVETVVDLVSPEFHPLAGRAKDIIAGSELVLCFAVSIVGLIVFLRALLS